MNGRTAGAGEGSNRVPHEAFGQMDGAALAR